MSVFLRPVDYSDDDDESRSVRAKPIDPKIARKLGTYASGKDFVMASMKSQQELDGLLNSSRLLILIKMLVFENLFPFSNNLIIIMDSLSNDGKRI